MRFSQGKSVAKNRGLGWGISFIQYCNLIAKVCLYCKRSLRNELGTGLDRINNNRGYYIDNVVPCCGVCNIVRSDVFSVKEMKLLGKVIEKIFIDRGDVYDGEDFQVYLKSYRERQKEKRRNKIKKNMDLILSFCKKYGHIPGDSGHPDVYENKLAILAYSYLVDRKYKYWKIFPYFYERIKFFPNKNKHKHKQTIKIRAIKKYYKKYGYLPADYTQSITELPNGENWRTLLDLNSFFRNWAKGKLSKKEMRLINDRKN